MFYFYQANGKFETLSENKREQGCTSIELPYEFNQRDLIDCVYFDEKTQSWVLKDDGVSSNPLIVALRTKSVEQAIAQLAQTIVTLPANERPSEQTTSMLAEQVVQLTNQNKTLQQAVATLAAQVVQAKGGN